jgi:hypothetical protein
MLLPENIRKISTFRAKAIRLVLLDGHKKHCAFLPLLVFPDEAASLENVEILLTLGNKHLFKLLALTTLAQTIQDHIYIAY